MNLYIYLFFQAEDGIRDGHVTGVQTCALPISFSKVKSSTAPSCVPRHWMRSLKNKFSAPKMRASCSPCTSKQPRSEERRVGKECKCRWSPECCNRQRKIRTGENEGGGDMIACY